MTSLNGGKNWGISDGFETKKNGAKNEEQSAAETLTNAAKKAGKLILKLVTLPFTLFTSCDRSDDMPYVAIDIKFPHFDKNSVLAEILDSIAKTCKNAKEFVDTMFKKAQYDLDTISRINNDLAGKDKALQNSKIESENKNAKESLDVQAQIMEALAEAKYYDEKN